MMSRLRMRKKGIAAWDTPNDEWDYEKPFQYNVKAFNTIGSSFYYKDEYDSALFLSAAGISFGN